MKKYFPLSLDPWLFVLNIFIVSAYISLIFVKPSGEGWGRGWNLVAYWLYLAPIVFIAGGLHLWRQKKSPIARSKLHLIVLIAAFIFPLISLAAIKLKA